MTLGHHKKCLFNNAELERYTKNVTIIFCKQNKETVLNVLYEFGKKKDNN